MRLSHVNIMIALLHFELLQFSLTIAGGAAAVSSYEWSYFQHGEPDCPKNVLRTC